MTQQRRFLFLLLSAAFVFAGSGAEAAGISGVHDRAVSAGFAPHKALYNIQLAEKRSGSQIVNIKGQMLYEWRPRCDAWTSDHRFNISYEYADSPAMNITSDFSTYEPFDGKTMHFTSRRMQDGRLIEELRGSASLGEDGTGKAVYSRPEDLSYDLPAGAVFPMGHSLAVLDKIHDGKMFYNTVLFDGSDEKGPVEVNTVIGAPTSPNVLYKDIPAVNAGLLSAPAHKVRLAFFPLDGDQDTTDYEMSIVFHENGVISDMMVEYHDFSVTQELVALEPLESGCENEAGRKVKTKTP